MKTLSISIITKNRKDILRQCLDSIYEKIQGIDYEIIVVDNNSNDGTSHMIMDVSDRVFSKFVFYYLRSYPWFYMKHRDLIR